MALGAIGAELPTVNVGVTIGAVLSNVGKNRPGVASGAGHFFVHSAQRVPRAVMIEFRNGADRNPTGAGVTIFAGNRERPVWAAAGLPLGDRGHGYGERKDHEREPTKRLNRAGNVCPLRS